MGVTDKIPLVQQISEVEREIAMRKSVYAKRVSDGKMRRSEADLQIAKMEAVHGTLTWLQNIEADVREFVRQKRGQA